MHFHLMLFHSTQQLLSKYRNLSKGSLVFFICLLLCLFACCNWQHPLSIGYTRINCCSCFNNIGFFLSIKSMAKVTPIKSLMLTTLYLEQNRFSSLSQTSLAFSFKFIQDFLHGRPRFRVLLDAPPYKVSQHVISHQGYLLFLLLGDWGLMCAHFTE